MLSFVSHGLLTWLMRFNPSKLSTNSQFTCLKWIETHVNIQQLCWPIRGQYSGCGPMRRFKIVFVFRVRCPMASCGAGANPEKSIPEPSGKSKERLEMWSTNATLLTPAQRIENRTFIKVLTELSLSIIFGMKFESMRSYPGNTILEIQTSKVNGISFVVGNDAPHLTGNVF